jgi:signal transduction histidine kinase
MAELRRIDDRAGRFRRALRTLAEADAANQAELTASRRRLVGTADQTRRANERDLHDGAQQRLVSLAVTLQYAQRLIGRGEVEEGGAVLQEALDGLSAGMAELTQLAAGIHPGVLRRDGLAAALEDLVGQSALTVGLDVDVDVAERIDEAVEVAAYFMVSEALTNTLKHAGGAAHARVVVRRREGELRVIVADDGRGGADIREGSGLRGLSDRVQALGGAFLVESPDGAGTILTALLPARPR